MAGSRPLPQVLLCEPSGLAHGLSLPLVLAARHGGIALIARTLREKRIADPFVLQGHLDLRTCLSQLPVDINPVLIGFSLLVSTLPRDTERMCRLKETFPNALFVVGGMDVRAIPEEVLFGALPVDYAVVGDGVAAIEELLSGELPSRRWVESRGPGSEEHPYPLACNPGLPTGHPGPMGVKPLRITFSSACSGGCAFCEAPRGQGFSDSDALLDIMSAFAYESDYLHFNDNTVFSHQEAFGALLDEFETRGFRSMPKYGKCRADQVDQAHADLLRYHNFCSLGIGVESFDDVVLKDLGKGYSQNRAESALECLIASRVAPKLFLILFSRCEDQSSLVRTLERVQLFVSQGAVLGGVMPWLAGSWETASTRGAEDFEWVRMEMAALRSPFRYPWREVCRDPQIADVQRCALILRDDLLKRLPRALRTQIHFQDLCLLSATASSLQLRQLSSDYMALLEREASEWTFPSQPPSKSQRVWGCWPVPPVLWRVLKPGYAAPPAATRMDAYARRRIGVRTAHGNRLVVTLSPGPCSNLECASERRPAFHAMTQVHNYLSLARRLGYEQHEVLVTSPAVQSHSRRQPCARLCVFAFDGRSFCEQFVSTFSEWAVQVDSYLPGLTVLRTADGRSLQVVDLEFWPGDSSGRLLEGMLRVARGEPLEEVILLGACGCAKGGLAIGDLVVPTRAYGRALHEIPVVNSLAGVLPVAKDGTIVSVSSIAEEDEGFAASLSAGYGQAVVVDLETEQMLAALRDAPFVRVGMVYEVTDSLEDPSLCFSDRTPRSSFALSPELLQLVYRRAGTPEEPFVDAELGSVGVTRISDATAEGYRTALSRLLHGDPMLKTILNDCRKVVIKPNCIVAKTPSTGTTSNVLLAEAIVEWIRREANPSATVSVVEGAQVGEDTPSVLSTLGYAEMCSRLGIECVNVHSAPWSEVAVPSPQARERVRVASAAIDADLIVNVPVIKTHNYTEMTCAIKNLKGLIPRREKIAFHQSNLGASIWDLCGALASKCNILTIVDGAVAQEGDGPVDGTPRRLGVLMCGWDPVAVDFVAARVMGIPWWRVPYLRFAGQEPPRRVMICGDAATADTRVRPFVPAYAVETAMGDAGPFEVQCSRACSGCRHVLSSVLSRIGRDDWPRSGSLPVPIAAGMDAGSRNPVGAAIGNCAVASAKAGEVSVTGCPPQKDLVEDALRLILDAAEAFGNTTQETLGRAIDYFDGTPTLKLLGGSATGCLASLLDKTTMTIDFGSQGSLPPWLYGDFIAASRGLLGVLDRSQRVSVFSRKLEAHGLTELLASFAGGNASTSRSVRLSDVADLCGARTVAGGRFLYRLSFATDAGPRDVFVKSDSDAHEHLSHRLADQLGLWHVDTLFRRASSGDGMTFMQTLPGRPVCQLFARSGGRLQLIHADLGRTRGLIKSLAHTAAFCDVVGKSDRNPGTARGLAENACNYFVAEDGPDVRVLALDFEYLRSDTNYLCSATRKGWSELAVLLAIPGSVRMDLSQVLRMYAAFYAEAWDGIARQLRDLTLQSEWDAHGGWHELVSFAVTASRHEPPLLTYLAHLPHFAERSVIAEHLADALPLEDIIARYALAPLYFKGSLHGDAYGDQKDRAIRLLRQHVSPSYAEAVSASATDAYADCRSAVESLV